MTGVYTDNQPDFAWLKPFEEKTFKQYFMPYKGIGEVKNATIHAAVNLELTEGEAAIHVYATGIYEGAKVALYHKGELCWEEEVNISPVDLFEKRVKLEYDKETDISAVVSFGEEVLVEYTPKEAKINKMPEPAKAAKDPKDIMTNEELFSIRSVLSILQFPCRIS